MDITRFNKELASRITTAKRHEKSGDIKSAIKLWLEISEMTISLSKNPKLDASFRNMLMNRVRGIFEHIKILKLGKIKEEIVQRGQLTEVIREESEDFQEQEDSEIIASSSNKINNHEITEDSDFKKLPKGFKEIKTSDDFEIKLLALVEGNDLEDQEGIKYLSEFLEYFCPSSDNYKELSDEGKTKIESILSSDSRFVKESISRANCNKQI